MCLFRLNGYLAVLSDFVSSAPSNREFIIRHSPHALHIFVRYTGKIIWLGHLASPAPHGWLCVHYTAKSKRGQDKKRRKAAETEKTLWTGRERICHHPSKQLFYLMQKTAVSGPPRCKESHPQRNRRAHPSVAAIDGISTERPIRIHDRSPFAGRAGRTQPPAAGIPSALRLRISSRKTYPQRVRLEIPLRFRPA